MFPEQPPVLIRRIGRGRGSWGLPPFSSRRRELTWIVVSAGFLSQRRLALVPRGPWRATPLPTPSLLTSEALGIPHPSHSNLRSGGGAASTAASPQSHTQVHTFNQWVEVPFPRELGGEGGGWWGGGCSIKDGIQHRDACQTKRPEQ